MFEVAAGAIMNYNIILMIDLKMPALKKGSCILKHEKNPGKENRTLQPDW